ncbi:MAG: bifunctional oligoribonuclease/PAP phosphatase NrnA [Bacteroidetes bacterium]|nr:bifunctional oligoribonuclease/PAP phosphatase NrnA [Bacteroidota bacterium]
MILQLETLKTIIDSHEKFILTSHVNPDGDSLGSEVALARYIKSRNKQAAIINCNATPDNYSFLNSLYPILKFDQSMHESIFSGAEVIILVDVNSPDRLNSVGPFVNNSGAVKVCIDHHPEPGEFADINVIDEQSPATAEIIYYFITMAGGVIDQASATALYTAIMTDTGSFRFEKTDAEIHTITAHLLQAGADPVAIYEQVYEHSPAKRIRLLGMALAGLKTLYDGRLAYIVITRDMFKETGTTEEDTDSFVPYTLAIDGVKIGLMFSETDSFIKVNFRSKGDIPINELAKEFGGNGHKNAAGARISRLKLDDAVSQVLKQADRYLK